MYDIVAPGTCISSHRTLDKAVAVAADLVAEGTHDRLGIEHAHDRVHTRVTTVEAVWSPQGRRIVLDVNGHWLGLRP
jgi:hypothetical protein